ncbi:ABC transporter ATP-binding protein [Tichowtungia aerotolerans]|uniref:ATP-binding cassette domain-containing protein n=1 Tax=Tichowtungia aerotolerans TaxID=2697043 RepID=A0A6P1M7Y2_9BACT|nr:ABC transporter ATP-binding protein [Tichowtungia aerotolerans]QHI68634.1 ATP-binding cassette domain-containing protein [Tichowtungia aerotolerans]
MSRPKNPSRGLARRLLRYALPYWPWLLLALVLVLTVSASINYLPVLIKHLTDQCLLDTSAPAATRIHLLGQISLTYLVITLIGYILRYAQGLLTVWIGQKIVYDLRVDVFHKALRMHQAWFDRTPVGTLLTRVTSDIERLQAFVTDGVAGTVADLFMLFGIMGYMLLISPRLSMVLFLLLPPLFALLFFVNHKLRNANRLIRKRQAALNALTQEDITGITTIQLFNRESAARSEFDERNNDLRLAHFEEVRWFSIYFPVIETGQAVTIAIILAAGGLWLLAGGTPLTAGALIAFLAYIRDFFRPLGSLSDKAGSFQIAMASAERLFALMDTPEEVNDPDVPQPTDKIDGTIAFENVSFAYTENNPVLRNISFAVEPGQVLAVVGATGSGKTTIINLIGRYYDAKEGRITIGGTDIRDFKKEDLRKRIGTVFQDPFIFAASVADNISLLNPALTRDDIVRAATAVNADSFIRNLPNGYDTELNERGGGLSLGQKQLLAMARALAQNPDLLFVLDEATASIDTATELLIQDALGKLVKNRTSIVIAHRLSTIRNADRILVMRHGELVDSGNHDELMARAGYYRNLYEMLQQPVA